MTIGIDTFAGVFVASFSARGLAQLRFPSERTHPGEATRAIAPPMEGWIDITREAIGAILSGNQPRAVPPLDLGTGTAFQQHVWTALQAIRLGTTRSYAEIAATVGTPGGMRAVGNACGANPIPLIIPCHRVVASGGKLGGFSGGLDWKKRLLTVEGVWPINARQGNTAESRQELLPLRTG